MRTTDPDARTGLFRTTNSPTREPPPDAASGPGANRHPTPRAGTIRATRLIRAAARRAREWADALTGPVPLGPAAEKPPPVPAAAKYERLSRVVLTDEVSRVLFGEYAAHRAGDRGGEETGWVLLGVREPDRAVVLATLPAGANRDAGEAHVRFNSDAQALASRIVRQQDRRLVTLGLVHTHPGRLRKPSGGDFDGDRVWVRNLRGQEGVFGIGTHDPATGADDGTEVGGHPRPHVQTYGGLRFDWYTLAPDDPFYRPVAVEIAIGPDLAAPLRGVWPAVEEHAARLDRLARQMTKVRFAVADGKDGPALAAVVGLGEPGRAVRVLMEGKTTRFLYEAGGEVFQPDLPAGVAPDQGVYAILAELAARD